MQRYLKHISMKMFVETAGNKDENIKKKITVQFQ